MDERPEDGQELLRQIMAHLEASLVLADKGGLLLAGARIADVLDTVRNSSKPRPLRMDIGMMPEGKD